MSLFVPLSNEGRGLSVRVAPWTWFAALVPAAAVVWLVGSRNPYTPAGYVGYLTRGAVFGHATVDGVQRGPTSPGRSWLLDVTNVSITPYTYTESFTGDDKTSGLVGGPRSTAVRHPSASGDAGANHH